MTPPFKKSPLFSPLKSCILVTPHYFIFGGSKVGTKLPTGRHEQFHYCASAYQRCDYRRLGIASKVGTNSSTGRHMKVSQWRITNISAVIIAASAPSIRQQWAARHFSQMRIRISAVIIAASTSLQKLVPNPPPALNVQCSKLNSQRSTSNSPLSATRKGFHNGASNLRTPAL